MRRSKIWAGAIGILALLLCAMSLFWYSAIKPVFATEMLELWNGVLRVHGQPNWGLFMNTANDFQFSKTRVNVSAGQVTAITNTAVTYYGTGYDGVIALTANVSGMAIYLPDATSVPTGYQVEVKDVSTSAASNLAHTVYIAGGPNATQLIDGQYTYTSIAQGSRHISFFSNSGGTWWTK